MRVSKGSVADPLEGYRLTAPHSTDANVAQLRRGCRQSLRAYRLTQRGGFAGTNLNVRGPRASCVNVRVTRPTPETLSYGVSRRADPGGPSLARFVDTRDSRFETRRLVLSRPRTAGASLRELGRRRRARDEHVLLPALLPHFVYPNRGCTYFSATDMSHGVPPWHECRVNQQSHVSRAYSAAEINLQGLPRINSRRRSWVAATKKNESDFSVA